MLVLAIVYKQCEEKMEVHNIIEKFVSSQLSDFLLGGGQISFNMISGPDLLLEENSKKISLSISEKMKIHSLKRANPESMKALETIFGKDIRNGMGVELTTMGAGHYGANVYGYIISSRQSKKFEFFDYFKENYRNTDKTFMYVPLSESEIYEILKFKYNINSIRTYFERIDKYLLYLGEQ